MVAKSGYNNIAFKVRVYDELYQKIVLEAGQLHLTVGEYARRVFEDRHQLLTLPSPAKPTMHAVSRDDEDESPAMAAERAAARMARGTRCLFVKSTDPERCRKCGHSREEHARGIA